GNDGMEVYAQYSAQVLAGSRVSGSTVKNNQGRGISIRSDNSAIQDWAIQSSVEISGNGGDYGSSGSDQDAGIYVYTYHNGTSNIVDISGNVIHDNQDNGILAYTYDGTLTPVISNNEIYSSGRGVYLYSYYYANASTVMITDNEIHEGTLGIEIDRNYRSQTLTVEVSRNKVYGHSGVGVKLHRDETTDSYGGLAATVQYNSIFHNNGNALELEAASVAEVHYNNLLRAGSSVYTLSNQSTQNVNAQENWWGKTTTSEIAAAVYDRYDNSAKGIVDYSNWLTEALGDILVDISRMAISPNNDGVADSTTITANFPQLVDWNLVIAGTAVNETRTNSDVFSYTWYGTNDGTAGGTVMPEGNYNATVEARSPADGSLVGSSVTKTLTVDLTGPQSVITNGPAHGSATSQSSVTFVWSGTDNFTPSANLEYAVSWDGAPFSAYSSDTTSNRSGLSQGLHTFTVKTRDNVGNEETTPESRSFTVDLSGPDPVASLSAVVLSEARVRLDWTASPSTDIGSYVIYWDNGTGNVNYGTPLATVGSTTINWTSITLAEGSYRFGVRAVDVAGNSSQPVEVGVTVYLKGLVDPISFLFADSHTVALWKMNEPNPTDTVLDVMGLHHGIPTGTRVIQSQNGNARLFIDGDHIRVPAAAALDLTETMTVEFLFRNSGGAANGILIGKMDAANTGWAIQLDGSGDLGVNINGSVITTGQKYQDGKWHYGAMLRKGTSLTLLIDGQPALNAAIVPGPISTSADLYFGARYLAGNFEGRLDQVAVDEVRISDTVRSNEELASSAARLNNEGLFVMDDDTLALWLLNETQGTVAVDQTGLHSGTYAGTQFVQSSFGFGRAIYSGTDRVVIPAFALSGSRLSLEAVFSIKAVTAHTQTVIGNFANGKSYALDLVSGKPRFRINNQSVTAPSAITPGQFVYVAGTYDGSAIKLFVNGTQVAQSAYSLPINQDPVDHILGGAVANSTDFLDGVLDEVRLSGRPLTTPEIQATYARFAEDHKAPQVSDVVVADDKDLALLTMTVSFDEDMDSTVQPAVTFGLSDPYDAYALTGSWLDLRTWRGTYSGALADDSYRASISRAADSAGNVMGADTGHGFVLDRFTTALMDPLDGTTIGTITGAQYDYAFSGQGLFFTPSDRLEYDASVINPESGTVEFHLLWYGTDGRILTITDGNGAPVILDIQAGTLILDINGHALLSSTVLVPGVWYHVAFTYGAAGFGLYVNGTLEAGSTTPVDLSAATGLVIGEFGGHASTDMTVDNMRTSTNEADMRLDVPTDFVAPALLSSRLSPSAPVRAETVTFTVDFSEPMDPSILPAVSLIAPDSVRYDVTDGAWADSDTYQGSFTFTTGMTNGTWRLSVSGARDLDQNRMGLVDSYSFELDTAPPDDPTVTVAVPSMTRVVMLPLSGTKDAYADIRINGVQRVAATVNTTWSYDYRLSQGAQSLVITSEDAAGNGSSALTYAVTLDTIPPALTINPVTSPTDLDSQTITGRTEIGAALTVNGTTHVAVNADGTWSYQTPVMSEGVNQFTFRADDTAGNFVQKSVSIDYDVSAPQPIPASLLQVDGNGDGKTVRLSWAGYAEVDVAYYRIYRESGSFSNVTSLNPVQTVNAGTSGTAVSGLTKGQTYYFAVVPVDDLGHFDPNVNAKPGTPADTQAPADVTGLHAVSVTEDVNRVNTIVLGWTRNQSDPDVTGQTLYFNAGTGEDGGTPLGAGVNSYTKNGLSDETQYTFRVTVKDTDGNESAGAFIQPVTVLRNPANLSAVPWNGKVTLTWDDLPSNLLGYVAGYNVYYSQNPFSYVTGFTPAVRVSATGMGGQAVITGLTNGVPYYFAVTTVNVSGGERKTVTTVSAAPRSDMEPPVIDSINITEGQVITEPYTINVKVKDAESAVASLAVDVDGVNLITGTSSSISAFYNIGLQGAIYQNGNHSIRIRTADTLGNQAAYSFGVMVSGAAPRPPVLTGTIPSGTVSTPTLTSVNGTAEEAQTITLLVNGVQWSQTAVVNGAGQFTFAAAAISEGGNELKAIASDRRGSSAPSNSLYVTLDTGAPGGPHSLKAEARAGGVVHFAWSPAAGEIPDRYHLYQSVSAFSSATAPGVRAVDNPGSPITVAETTYLPDNDLVYYYAVTALDESGNESPISNVVSVAGDRVSPDAVLAVDPDRLIEGSVIITVATTEDLSELPFVSVIPAGVAPIPVSMKASGANRWTGTFTVQKQMAHGAAAITYSGKDFVGNRSAVATGETSFFIDHQSPKTVITLSPSAPFSVKTDLNVGITVRFDETVSGTPLLDLNTPDGSRNQIALTAQPDGSWTGTQRFTLSMLGGQEIGECSFAVSAVDLVGNMDTVIIQGETFFIYNNQPPPLDAPILTAVVETGGRVDLVWTGVPGAAGGYNLYRRTAAQLPSEAVPVIMGWTETELTDGPLPDDTYYYSVEAVDIQGYPGLLSAEVPATTDATPPEPPATLTLKELGSGINASWPASAGAAVYRLYQSATGTILPGISRKVAETTALSRVDNQPDAGANTYGITAVDAAGNESAATTAQIGVALPPVSQLTVTRTSLGKAVLNWTSKPGMSYHVYRNGAKVTATALAGGPYTDNFYNGGTVVYGVSATDGVHESGVREITLPKVSLSMDSNQTLRRGAPTKLKLSILNNETQDQNFDELQVGIGTGALNHVPLVSPVPAGSQLTVEKVVAAPVSAASQETVNVTLVGRPEPGSEVRIESVSKVYMVDSGVTLEILNHPLIRGGQAEIQLKIFNNTDLPIDIVTATDGGKKPSPDVKVDLADVNGNVLASGSLMQYIGGAEFVTKTNGVTRARIEPGASLTFDSIRFVIPTASPHLVYVNAVVGKIYYDYAGADEVAASGLALEKEVFLSDTSYSVTAQVEGEKNLFSAGPVRITGSAISNTTGNPMAYVPVKVGVSVKGFDRYLTATTDQSGQFVVNFIPGPNEAGVYTIWGAHPDIYDRYVQDTFTISSFIVTPSLTTWRVSKNDSIVVPIKLTNPGETKLTNLTYSVAGSNAEITGAVNGAGDLQAGETRTVNVTISVGNPAVNTGLATVTARTAEGAQASMKIELILYEAQPYLSASPSFVEGFVHPGEQAIRGVTFTNEGFKDLINARISGPSTSWIGLDRSRAVGTVPAGAGFTLGVVMTPPAGTQDGIYTDSFTVEADNHPPYIYYVQVHVTSANTGNVTFSVTDSLYENVEAADVSIQHAQVLSIRQDAKTDANGSATFTDLPTGSYNYTVSAPGHKSWMGTFQVQPGYTTPVEVVLENVFVTIEWSVVPIVIEDRYEIRITTTFVTDVPAPVVVVEPAFVNLPRLEKGQVYYGEYKVTNHGLIAAKDVTLQRPASNQNMAFEILGTLPDRLDAMESVPLPFRITWLSDTPSTELQTLAALSVGDDPLLSEITGYGGGGGCTICGSITYRYPICPGSGAERTGSGSSSYCVGTGGCGVSGGGYTGGVGYTGGGVQGCCGGSTRPPSYSTIPSSSDCPPDPPPDPCGDNTCCIKSSSQSTGSMVSMIPGTYTFDVDEDLQVQTSSGESIGLGLSYGSNRRVQILTGVGSPNGGQVHALSNTAYAGQTTQVPSLSWTTQISTDGPFGYNWFSDWFEWVQPLGSFSEYEYERKFFDDSGNLSGAIIYHLESTTIVFKRGSDGNFLPRN
ncbi:MAG: hypothetical protein COZ95_10915, partial [Nitrospirae bacterium CG_4_8_14_3_um_filter_50_41]